MRVSSIVARLLAILVGCALSTGIVYSGLLLGNSLINSKPRTLLPVFSNVDGGEYIRIVETGYFYLPNQPSNVAFFPLYPLLARLTVKVSGINTTIALLAWSNLLFLSSCVLAALYAEQRFPRGVQAISVKQCWLADSDATVLMLMTLPTAFFFRLAYSESLFLFLQILTLYLINRKCSTIVVAIVVALAGASRPVGIALLLPLCIYIWQNSPGGRVRVVRSAYGLFVGASGLISYMGFQYARFGNPFVFALTQHDFKLRPAVSWTERVVSLLAGEPIREVYTQNSPAYWKSVCYVKYPVFSLDFANPIYLLGAMTVITVGIFKKWLNVYEASAAIALLFVPYFARGYEMEMRSQGRFAVVVFPVSMVMGKLLCRTPPLVGVLIVCFSAMIMAIYSALYASDHMLL